MKEYWWSWWWGIRVFNAPPFLPHNSLNPHVPFSFPMSGNCYVELTVQNPIPDKMPIIPESANGVPTSPPISPKLKPKPTLTGLCPAPSRQINGLGSSQSITKFIIDRAVKALPAGE